MTDEEWTAKLRVMLRQMNDAAREKTTAPDGVPVWRYIACDIASQAVEPLLAEVERLHAALAARDEIVRAVAESYEGLGGSMRDVVLCYNDNAGELECPWCHGSEDKRAGFVHESDCPVTKARALQAGEEGGQS